MKSTAQESPAQESKPGLVATYSDQAGSVTRVVATPHFRLRNSESIHPQVGTQFTAEWRGVLKIDRAGKYRVFAEGAVVEVAGQNTLVPLMLATGEHPLSIRFERKQAGVDSRMELRWLSDFFRDEPVPSSTLRHIEEPQSLVAQDAIERGRFLFAELGCANCHSAANWNLQSRRGPDLTNVGSRVQASWLYQWLKEPHSYRKSAVMPVCLDADQDRADVAAYVKSLGASEAGTEDVATDAQIATGKELFETVGCVKCHDKNNSLDGVGSKYTSAARLTEFIADPHRIDPHGRMPSLFNGATEQHLARSVASFLFSTMKPARPYAEPPAGDAARGAKLFVSNGCASCHSVSGAAITREEILAGPAFGQPKGLALRNFWDFGDLASSTPVEDRVSGSVEKIVGKQSLLTSNDDRVRSFDFDGKTFIEVPHFHRPDTMTISAWVKTTQGGSIITWGRPGGQLRGSRELRMNIGQDGKNSLCYGEYNSDGGWKPVVVRPKDVNLIDGHWHHIALVRRGETITHFVDGKPQGSGKAQKGGGDYTDRLLIGALGLSGNPSNRFQGQIDDLSIWELALSDAQVAALATGASPLAMARPKGEKIKPFDIQGGCLASNVKRPLPDYRLNGDDRSALQSFLATVHPDRDQSYQHSPRTTHELRIRQFRCTACHERDHENIQKGVAVDEQGRVVRVERPPVLTGVGSKLTASWIREVLVDRKRNRPWLNLRMPHFGQGVVNLPELMTASAGALPDESGPKPDRSLAEAGLQMIGVRRGKVSCITCHDYRGINRRKDGVVPAPDLADAGRTVRREWFDRWMHDPQRLQPGTSMPQLFLDVSSEERDLRIAQLWSALYYQKQLPLPKGVLDQTTEGTKIVVKDKPVLFRMATVTPVGQIDRAINVGIPGGLNFTFDAVTCRLKYAWKGDFIDAGPAWNGRGGNPVKAGGEALAALKSGHHIQIGSGSATDTLRFRGYRLENQLPVFRYEINGASVEHRVTVSDSAVVQRFVVKNPSA
ncbi:MAG: c-type cytochrome, partial [Planctomycetes bacterium]|nr:c-type cytochrome [Planctomycetota bacterium]